MNNANINVVKNAADKKLISVLDLDNINFSTAIEKWKSYPSVLNIKKHSEQEKCFTLAEVLTVDVLKLIKLVKINILPKVVETIQS